MFCVIGICACFLCTVYAFFINDLGLVNVMIKVRRESDFRNAQLLQTLFPDIGRGYKKVKNLRILSFNILNSKDDNYFKKRKYSTESLLTPLRIVLAGGDYKGETLEGLLGDEYSKISGEAKSSAGLLKIKEVNGYSNWTKEEEDFVVGRYEAGKSPQKIFSDYNEVKSFTPRMANNIDDFLSRKVIRNQRIDWDKIGGDAISFLYKYAFDSIAYSVVVRALNRKYFGCKYVVNKGKLSNFYRKNNMSVGKARDELLLLRTN